MEGQEAFFDANTWDLTRTQIYAKLIELAVSSAQVDAAAMGSLLQIIPVRHRSRSRNPIACQLSWRACACTPCGTTLVPKLANSKTPLHLRHTHTYPRPHARTTTA